MDMARLTKKEKEVVFDAVSRIDDLAQEGRIDYTPDETEAIHSAFLRLRMNLRGF